MRSPKTIGQLERQVSLWNDDVEVGASVYFINDLGKITATRTRSKAWVLGGHSAVVMIEDVTGCVLLDRVQENRP
jgi:hypothetical protein